MKAAVKVWIVKAGERRTGFYWQVWFIGASGRRIMVDCLTPDSNYYGKWYASDTFVGVGFKTLAAAKKWFTQNMFEQHPEFVGGERCDACAIVGDCPNPCPILRYGY